MTAGWGVRAVRAAVFAAVCVLLAALGHVMMSGRDVPAWALTAGLGATGVTGWCLARGERGLPLIVVVTVVAQTALHQAFAFAQSATAASGAAPGAMGMRGVGSLHMSHMDMSHMDMSHMSMTHMGTGHMDLAHMDHAAHIDHAANTSHAMTTGSPSSGMLAAHLLAAVLCGLWLAFGEKAAFRILRAVAGRLAAPLRLLLALPLTPERPRPHQRHRRPDRTPRLLLLVHAITSRGPPVGTAVA